MIGRIEACGRRNKASSTKNTNKHGATIGTKVHISMASSFPVGYHNCSASVVQLTLKLFSQTGHVIKPTESRLRRHFIQFGTVLDVQVNFFASVVSPSDADGSSSRQEGYGFITFEDSSVAETILNIGTHFVDGIEVMCSFSTERVGLSASKSFSKVHPKNSTYPSRQQYVPPPPPSLYTTSNAEVFQGFFSFYLPFEMTPQHQIIGDPSNIGFDDCTSDVFNSDC